MSDSLLQSFHRHLQARGLAASTRERYASSILRLLAFADVPASDVTAAHAYAHLVDQSTRLGLSASWYNVQFVAVVRWFEFRGQPLDLRGLLPQRRPLAPPRALSLPQVRQLFSHVGDTRYRMAFELTYATGLRISELVALRLADIDRDRPLIRIEQQKGGDSRLVILSATLRERLRAYWWTWRPHTWVFERRPGDHRGLLPETLRRAFTLARDRAGLPDTTTVHSLRHTFATHALRAGVDIVTLSRLMGHRCIQSTTRYLTPDLTGTTPVTLDLLAGLESAPAPAVARAQEVRP